MQTIALVRLTCAVVLTLAGAVAQAQSLYAMRGPWVDDAEKPFQLDALAGTYTVVTMAYGACQKVCSTSVRRVRQLHELAERRHLALNFVVVGLDPAADKPSDWALFRTEEHLTASDFRFLSGPPAAIQQIANWLGVRYWRYGEHTMHDFRVVLVSPAGRIIRSVDHFDDDVALLLP